MTPAARLSAAIDILATIDANRVPAAQALKEWGVKHRFAGSGDRAAISGLVFDALRRRASAAYLMGEDTPRARLLGALKLERGMGVEAIARLCDGSRFAPQPLNAAEQAALASGTLAGAPAWAAGDYPEWLDADLAAAFGEARVSEGAAQATRAPLDLRVNALKGHRNELVNSLAHLGVRPTPYSPLGLRIDLGADARNPGITSEPEFLKGRVEVQDEGSQIAALLSGARAGETVIDLCAGAGGKTLALAAMMQNKGRLIATDSDKRQLAPIHERLARAGAANVEVRTPRGDEDILADLAGQADLVFIDAPCTGTGTWRRNPDAKWRIRPGALEVRLQAQREVLDRAAGLVRPGGRLVYVTCSVLPSENAAQVRDFVGRHGAFEMTPPAALLASLGEGGEALGKAAVIAPEGLTLTPRRTATDGFFIAILKKVS